MSKLSSWLRRPPRQQLIGDWRQRADVLASTEQATPSPLPAPGSSVALPTTELRPIFSRTSEARIHRAFSSALPVGDRYGLTGRSGEIGILAANILAQHKHGIIFGARGSGKTSLARVFGDLADEADCMALYGSVSGDLSFTHLFRPYLDDLPGADHDGTVARMAASLKSGDFDVRQLAMLFAEVRTQTVLVLDEFDLIRTQSTKDEVASLLKSLTDLHAKVQLLLVGIAGNVDELLTGHPSLRRHMVAIPIGPISKESMLRLIGNCADAAGMSLADEALETLGSMAMGSPYHGRLFGVQAALAAEAGGGAEIGQRDVKQGFRSALHGWASMSADTHATVQSILAHQPDAAVLLSCIAVVAAAKSTFTAEGIVRLCDANEPRPQGWSAAMAALLERLAPVVRHSGGEDVLIFKDTLAPQFVRLMVADARDAPTISGDEDRDEVAEDFRLALKGLNLS